MSEQPKQPHVAAFFAPPALLKDETLDEFVMQYCEQNSIECDGDVFGIWFSDCDHPNGYSHAEIEAGIEEAAKLYDLRLSQ